MKRARLPRVDVLSWEVKPHNTVALLGRRPTLTVRPLPPTSLTMLLPPMPWIPPLAHFSQRTSELQQVVGEIRRLHLELIPELEAKFPTPPRPMDLVKLVRKIEGLLMVLDSELSRPSGSGGSSAAALRAGPRFVGAKPALPVLGSLNLNSSSRKGSGPMDIFSRRDSFHWSGLLDMVKEKIAEIDRAADALLRGEVLPREVRMRPTSRDGAQNRTLLARHIAASRNSPRNSK